MERKVSNHESKPHITTMPPNHNSRSISKLKPNIRIVHLIAPEIIKTDVTNFRDLVQELTGKSSTTNKRKLKISANTANPKKTVYQETTEKEEKVVKCEDQWINMEEGTSYLSYFNEDLGEIEELFQFDFSSSSNIQF